jgi:hypothetical protein
MDWTAFVLAIKFSTLQFCIETYPKDRIEQIRCRELMEDCVFDGESLEFCKQEELTKGD